MAPTADTSEQFTIVVRKSAQLAAAKNWLKIVRRKIHAGQSKSEKPATKVADPLGLAAPKIRRTRGGRMAQGRDDLPIFAERARLAKWTPEGIASLPELFTPLPKDGNFKVVDEFKNVLMVVRRVASDTEQDTAFPQLREIGMQADNRETGIDVRGQFNNEPMLLRWQTGNAIQVVQQ
jgi:hypothetical protein